MQIKRKTGSLLILLGIAALFFSLYWTLFYVGLTPENLRIQYAFLTNQVTVLCGAYLILCGVYYCGAKRLGGVLFHTTVKTAVAAYAAIVGIGYHIGIIPFSMLTVENLYVLDPQSIYMHAINPVIMAIVYIRTPFIRRQKSPCVIMSVIWVLIYPLVFLIFSEMRAYVNQFYVYPFLDPQIMGGMNNVLLASLAVMLTGAAIIIGFMAHSHRWAALDSNID